MFHCRRLEVIEMSAVGILSGGRCLDIARDIMAAEVDLEELAQAPYDALRLAALVAVWRWYGIGGVDPRLKNAEGELGGKKGIYRHCG
jgi:hypothetical protein